MEPSIVFDFDGTLALGHGPVRAFAQQVAPATGQDGFLERVEAELSSYDAGQSEYRDGYDIVGSMAKEAGASDEELQAAYLASRDVLGSAGADVDTMPGLAAFLTELGRVARLVLATNAPEAGIAELLERWGVADLFDERHFNLGKPAGLEGLVDRLIEGGPVLSIGDIAVNDLVPAAARGAATALVGARYEHAPIPVTMQAPSLSELRDAIITWAAHQPAESAPAQHPAQTTPTQQPPKTWAAQQPSQTPAAPGAGTTIER
ncbi:haloacid dehalogenase-like hydrolase [Leucobacter sp. UCMA 4100]|uniref:HAD family hydrolase n=1 Tax=Leucobacter sp. UCMA 4100 TaxID=2810534 RepID=UPI0022EB051B|nr:HAD family hydrolase [Leucobacter sp. UCMA 4100]MDA3147232.1 haloacid dehalogenase-like hydrolase [Leucobacter sp. UCMA 4100]